MSADAGYLFKISDSIREEIQRHGNKLWPDETEEKLRGGEITTPHRQMQWIRPDLGAQLREEHQDQ